MSEPDADSYNPGQTNSDRIFYPSDSARSEDGPSYEDAEQQARQAEENPLNYEPFQSTASLSRSSSSGWGKIFNRRVGAIGGIGGILIGGYFGMSVLSPFGVIVGIKENITDWADKFMRDSNHRRISVIGKYRFYNAFSSTACRLTSSAKCRLKSGLTQAELDKMKKENLVRDGDYKKIGEIDGKARYSVSQFRYRDTFGKEITVSASEFRNSYSKIPQFLSAMNDTTITTRALNWRGIQGVHRYYKYNVLRKYAVGRAKSLAEFIKAFRKKMLQRGSSLTKASGNTDDDTRAIIEEAAADIDRAALASDGLNPSEFKAAVQSASGAMAAKLASLGGGCVATELIYQMSILAKTVKVASLIQFSGTIASVIDQTKAGDMPEWEQPAGIGNAFTKESADPLSKGKTASDSDGYTLATQGGYKSIDGLLRFATGTPALGMLAGISSNGIVRAIEQVCQSSGIRTPAGQIITTLLDFVSSKTWLGLAGKVVATGLVFFGGAKLLEWLMPQMINYLLGTVVPDIEKDIEGSYAVGNAYTSGMGSFGSQQGRGGGNRTIKQEEFRNIDEQADESSQVIAAAEAISNPAAERDKALQQLAVKLLPLSGAVSQGNIGGVMTNLWSITQGSPATIASIFSRSVGAKDPYVDKYLGTLCDDPDYAELQLYTDYNCAPIQAQDRSEITSDQYNPENILDTLIQQNTIFETDNKITEQVFYGDLDVWIQRCQNRPLATCVPMHTVTYEPIAGAAKLFKNSYCAAMMLHSPDDNAAPNCMPDAHSWDFIDHGNRLDKYSSRVPSMGGLAFATWYATCIRNTHPIVTPIYQQYLQPQFDPIVLIPITQTDMCSDTDPCSVGPNQCDSEQAHRYYQLYVKDRNIEDGLEAAGTDKLGSDNCTDPILPLYGNFCASGQGNKVPNGSGLIDPYSQGSTSIDVGQGEIQAFGGGGIGTPSIPDGGTPAQPTVPATGSDQELAKQILATGKVTGDSRYINQIKAYADGNFSCNIDHNILVLIATAAKNHTIYITSLNRLCTGVFTSSTSYHWVSGGGHAVDIGIVDGVKSTGGTAKDIAFLNELLPTMPAGSQVGQRQCRPSGSVTIPAGFREIEDGCDHNHLGVKP
ncbi:MAG: hypothetical protein WBB39_04515 [Candidatus Saccharimonadales bacterium]